MNTLELEKCLRLNTHTNKTFKGVFAANQLPTKPIKLTNKGNAKLSLVANVSVDSKPGLHWICFVISNSGTLEYFDTSGESYRKNKYFKKFVQTNCKNRKIIFYKKKIQSDFSDLCGEYVCLYILARSRNIPPDSFYQCFNHRDLIENDYKAFNTFNSYFKCRKQNCNKNYYPSTAQLNCNQYCKSIFECKNK